MHRIVVPEDRDSTTSLIDSDSPALALICHGEGSRVSQDNRLVRESGTPW